MKKILILTILPVVLLGLETVNLIKDASFEKDSEVWQMRSEAEGQYDSTIISYHDSEDAYIGEYCGSIDTRIRPAPTLPELYDDWGEIYQIPVYRKRLEDLDSLILFHKLRFVNEGEKTSAFYYITRLKFYNPNTENIVTILYSWLAPDLTSAGDDNFNNYFPDTLGDENTWLDLQRDLNADISGIKGLPFDIELDTFLLYSDGGNDDDFWRGHKAFFDGIRLTGWADYNIALPRFTGSLEQPAAMVWNNGREDQTDITIIATIEGGEPYSDTVILPSLASDDSTEVTFAEFGPITPSGNYHLTIATGGAVGMLDECDEDDVLYEEYTGVTESVIHQAEIQLEVTIGSIRYFLPEGQPGVLSVFDPSGRLVESRQVRGSGQLSLAYLPAGLYFVRLEMGKGSVTRKAVILN